MGKFCGTDFSPCLKVDIQKDVSDITERMENERLLALTAFEEKARSYGHRIIAGIDEAGRGPLAGPVVAGACIIPSGIYFRGINDSKKLSAKQRDHLFDEISNHPAVIFGIGIISHEEIDRINIYQATIQAMLQAVSCLKLTPHWLLVDGMKLPHPNIPCEKIIGGDGKSQSIAAASILAKVTRDRLMEEYDAQWPVYGFKKHKGYGTPEHLKAIASHGRCPIHRMTFKPDLSK